jgi:hypothetical protein
MPAALRKAPDDQPHYSVAEIVETRRQILRFARSIPPGPERNLHLQVAVSLGRLFSDKAWRNAHVGDAPKADSCDRYAGLE